MLSLVVKEKEGTTRLKHLLLDHHLLLDPQLSNPDLLLVIVLSFRMSRKSPFLVQ